MLQRFWGAGALENRGKAGNAASTARTACSPASLQDGRAQLHPLAACPPETPKMHIYLWRKQKTM